MLTIFLFWARRACVQLTNHEIYSRIMRSSIFPENEILFNEKEVEWGKSTSVRTLSSTKVIVAWAAAHLPPPENLLLSSFAPSKAFTKFFGRNYQKNHEYKTKIGRPSLWINAYAIKMGPGHLKGPLLIWYCHNRWLRTLNRINRTS